MAELGNEKAGSRTKRQEEDYKRRAVGKHHAEQPAIAFPKSGEASLETGLHPYKRTQPRGNRTWLRSMTPVLDVAVKPHHESRNQSAGNDVAGKYREYDRFSKGHEEIACNPGEEEHGHEHDTDA